MMRNTILLVLYLCCVTSPLNAKEKQVPPTPPYTIIKDSSAEADRNKPPFHPRMEGARNEYTMLSVQDEDLLRVFFYHPSGTSASSFDVHNPSKRDFTGMPAMYQSGVNKPGVIFADGTKFDPYLPPDAWCSGGTEWVYYMRWRRVHGNYYFVTFYRVAEVLVYTALMTEKKGQNLVSVLGESSSTADMSKYDMAGVFNPVVLQYIPGEKVPIVDMTLIPVEEKDLPPDFPKNLVRWIP